jgi:hypothetical protein
MTEASLLRLYVVRLWIASKSLENVLCTSLPELRAAI